MTFASVFHSLLTSPGNKYWTFHDRDIAPEGNSWQETNRNLDEMVDLAAQLQKQHGIKLLWATCNLFSHPRCVVYHVWPGFFVRQKYEKQADWTRWYIGTRSKCSYVVSFLL